MSCLKAGSKWGEWGPPDKDLPNLEGKTEYNGLPVYRSIVENDQVYVDIDGVRYQYIETGLDADTEWQAWQTDEIIGYRGTDFSLMSWRTLKNDPEREFLVKQWEQGEGLTRDLYGRADMPIPQVDIETVDRIRFYIGEGDRDAQKEDLQQGNVTEDKELIKRFLDAKDEWIDTFEGEPHFVGLLSLESDQYPMLAFIYGVYQNDSGIYAVSTYEDSVWNETFERRGAEGGAFWDADDFLDIPQDVMLALMGQTSETGESK